MDFFTGYSNNKGVGKVSTKLKETNVSQDVSLNNPLKKVQNLNSNYRMVPVNYKNKKTDYTP